MALSNVFSWIFSMILLNHGIITVTSFPLSIDGLIEFGLDLLIDKIFHTDAGVNEEPSMDDLASKIDNLENTIKNSEKKIIAEVGELIKSNAAMSRIHEALIDINYHHKVLNDDIDDCDTKDKLVDYAKKCISTGHNSLTYLLHKVKTAVTSNIGMQDLPIFKSAVQPYLDEEKAAGRCGKTISVQQEIYKIYGIVSMYVIKTYNIILEAYETLEKFEDAKYGKRKERTEDYVMKDLRIITKFAVLAMREAPRDIRSCDPEIHEEGETYITLKRLFDTVLISESDLLGNQDDCSRTCEDFKKKAPRSSLDGTPKGCLGTFHDCTDTKMKSYSPARGSDRRYDAVRESPILTSKDVDNRGIRPTYNLYFQWCDGCACTCDNVRRLDTVRWFSYTPIQSKAEENYVITGLRLVEINSIIYIQIQEGQLQPNGRVLASTVEWQPVIEGSKENSWRVIYDQKSVNLDTLVAPHLQVMTGIKFDRLDSHLVLSIRAHEFDYSSGVLHDGDGSWISNEITDREEIKIGKVANPLDAEGENIVASGEKTYVNFHMTHWDFNLTQVAVPFIDAQAVVIDPPLPLAGAGLYYRGRTGYGGFLALKLVALDYAEMLRQKIIVQAGSEAEEGQVNTEEEIGTDAEEDGEE